MAENDSLLEMFVYENSQLLEQLENMLLGSEKNALLSKEQIDETFRVMHTIKGSAAMMDYTGMSGIAHAVEDMFSKIREAAPDESEWEAIFDIVLEAIDLFKDEIIKIQNGEVLQTDAPALRADIDAVLKRMNSDTSAVSPPIEPTGSMDMNFFEQPKGEEIQNHAPYDAYFRAALKFDAEGQMETIRAFAALNSIRGLHGREVHFPGNLDINCDDEISLQGFTIFFEAEDDARDVARERLEQAMFLQSLELEEISETQFEKMFSGENIVLESYSEQVAKEAAQDAKNGEQKNDTAASQGQPVAVAEMQEDKNIKQSFISVNINKIDKLMNLVGEIVTTESMVTKNPEIINLKMENFDKQARLLRKLTDELQSIVMSIRMVPISSTFHKMQRIVRDMCKKINKNAELVLIGEETEVDKNIIDSLSDPLMHLIRNAMDHGLDTPEERIALGKPEKGIITLEAKNSGGDIIVKVSDDGRGLNRDRIIQKAIEKGLTTKTESEISDKEAWNFILMAGFSTKEQVTEFSGRGVGMDVVRKNIDNIGGSIAVESELGKGMTITMHIPLTLAIMDGMNIAVGKSQYIIPMLTIRSSLEPRLVKIITEPNGNELAIVRGETYPILRVHRMFDVETDVQNLNDGILVLVESEAGTACLFADKLLGEQQAVVKPMPLYVSKNIGRIKGVAGCSIMGDGGIALILDINSLLI